MNLESANLVTRLFDKRNDFNSKTLKLIYFKSNVHISVKRNVYRNGLIHNEGLSSRVKDMFKEIIKWYSQGFEHCYPCIL